MITKPNASLNYDGYRININKLIHRQHQKERLTPSNMTEEDLLNLRAKSYFQQMKGVALNQGSIENDLLMSVQSEGLTFMNPNMNITPQILLKETEFNQPNITDPQFIQNFAVKEAFYRDQIHANFSGEELTQRLQQFEQSVNGTKEKLATLYSKTINRFLTNEESWLYNDNPVFQSVDQGNTTRSFNMETFKQHVLDMMKTQADALQTIKGGYKEDWQLMIDTGGKNIDFFQKGLKDTLSTHSETSDPPIEQMSFRDMKELGNLINGLGKGISTNSDAHLGAYLGQMQAMTSLFLQNSSMSATMKDRIQQAVQSKIETKIKWAKITPASEQILNDNLERFNKVAAISAEKFRASYMTALSALKGDLGQNQFAIEAGETLAQDWNRFVELLSVDRSVKEYYLVPTLNYSVFDVRV